MTKTFEEEFKGICEKVKDKFPDTEFYALPRVEDVIEYFKDWHSDEEYQELKAKAEEYKESARVNYNDFRDLQKQLQQQALPVVPEFVAKDVKRLSLSTLADWNVAVSYISKETLEWLSTTGNINVFLGKSWTLCSLKINGFKVEKPQLFKLIFPNSTAVLQKDGELNSFADTVYKRYLTENAMTEQEIKSIDERYWQFAVPVEDGVMGYELKLDDLAQRLAEGGININDLNLIEVAE